MFYRATRAHLVWHIMKEHRVNGNLVYSNISATMFFAFFRVAEFGSATVIFDQSIGPKILQEPLSFLASRLSRLQQHNSCGDYTSSGRYF